MNESCQPHSNISRLRKTLYILIPYVAVALLILIGEIAARKVMPPISELALFTRVNFEHNVAHDINRGQQIFEADPDLAWRLKPNLNQAHWDFTTFSTNDQHIRYYKNIGKKEKDTIRILALGDSVTFGYRVPVAWPHAPLSYDSSHKPYTVLLEEKLSHTYPNKIVEVVPLAAPGYTSYQGLLWLKREIKHLKPDLITILYGWNDIQLHPNEDKDILPFPKVEVLAKKLMSRSRLFAFLVQMFHGNNKKSKTSLHQAPPVSRVSLVDYVENILKMHTLAKDIGAHTLIIGPVVRDIVTASKQTMPIVRYREALKKAAKKRSILYLEVPELTEKNWPQTEQLFGELIHPNHIGHKLIAEKLWGQIQFGSDPLD